MNNKVISSLIWKFLERGGTQIVQFIVQIILARLLLPNDYGVVAIVTIFITIANVFVQTGFNTALIQKKEVNDIDYSSVFYLSLFVALILYIIIFFMAPIIAQFYDNAILVPVFRVLSLTLFLGAINSIQSAVIARRMEFKKYFFSSIGAIILSGIIGIILAYTGYGVWSLVVQQLANMLMIILILWFTVDWRPKLLFSWKRLKSLFSYGWKLLCSSLIDTIYNNLYDLVIGKKYSSSDLAFYNRGRQFPYLIVNNVNGSISTVLLPAMSEKQDDKMEVKKMTRKSIIISSFIMFPMMFGLVAIARPLVIFLLTEKWIECIPFLQLLCFSYALWPIHTANLQAINAIGRSDVFLKLEIIKKIIGILVLILTIPMGLIPMAIGQVIISIVSTFINAYPNKKLLNYSYIEQMKDMFPSFMISIIMILCIYPLSFIPIGKLTIVILQVILGIVVYVLLAYLFKVNGFTYMMKIINDKFRKKV